MKGYLVAWIRIHDAERYALYRDQGLAILDRIGADLLAAADVRDGARAQDGPGTRVLICSFSSFRQAQDAVRSRQFATALQLMRASCEFDYAVIPGIAPEGELPGELFPFPRSA
ncbi:MAG: DUF1330 domain-containing protein [Hasllibacter sp.]